MSDCIFCKIIEGEIPAKVVYEDENVKVFEDIAPVAPVHLIIIPKFHMDSINSLDVSNEKYVLQCLVVAKKVAKMVGVEKSGYRIVTNCGNDGGQTVNHLHFHLIGGKKLEVGMG